VVSIWLSMLLNVPAVILAVSVTIVRLHGKLPARPQFLQSLAATDPAAG